MRVFAYLLLAAIVGIAVAETNVTGKWSGSVNASTPEGDKQEPAVLMLKQDGSEITGTVGPNEGEQHAITKGKIEGNKITLLIESENRTIKLDLVAANDRMIGNVSVSREGETMTAKLDVTRAK